MTAEQSVALFAVEQQVRTAVAAHTAAATAAINAALTPAIRRTDPASGTGSQVVSDPATHQRIVAALTACQAQCEDTASSGYSAAAVIALAAMLVLFAEFGHDLPARPPTLVPGGATGTLATLLAGITLAFADARTSIVNDVAAGFDGVSGSRSGTRTARIVVAHGAVSQAVRRLNGRVTAAAVVGVYAGNNETELVLWREYQQINPYIGIRKRWQVRAADPCPACRALDGTTAGLDEEFHHGDDRDPPVFGRLLGPPRHPNCRCRLVFDT
jgi:hypothetical protein